MIQAKPCTIQTSLALSVALTCSTFSFAFWVFDAISCMNFLPVSKVHDSPSGSSCKTQATMIQTKVGKRKQPPLLSKCPFSQSAPFLKVPLLSKCSYSQTLQVPYKCPKKLFEIKPWEETKPKSTQTCLPHNDMVQLPIIVLKDGQAFLESLC